MDSRPTTRVLPASGGEHLERSHEWLRTYREDHRGRWVALLADALIGSDPSRKTLQQLVNAHPEARRILVVWVAA